MKTNFFKKLLESNNISKKIKKSNIIFFFPAYHVGGAERVHVDILSVFKNQKTLCIFTEKSENNAFKQEFESQCETFESKYLSRKKLVEKIAKNINSKQKPIIFGCNSYVFYDLIPHLKPHVLIVDLLHAFSYEIPTSCEKYSLNYINRLDKRVVLGQKTFRDFKELYIKNNVTLENLKKINIIQNKVNTPDFFPAKPINEKLKILFVGRNSSEKRPELFFEIANICSNKNLKVDFFVIGDFKNYPYQITKNITIIGEIFNKTELNQHYTNSDLLLITSSREGFPMVVLEGMAHGVVPICTNVGEISEFINNENNNGFIIQNNQNVENIANNFVKQIEILENNRNILTSISLNAYQCVKSNFSMAKFSESYIKLLKHK